MGKDSSSYVTVVDRGSIQTSELSSSRADRLSLESNCSLTVKDVTAEDAGTYVCQQWKKDQKYGVDKQVDLFVLSITNEWFFKITDL